MNHDEDDVLANAMIVIMFLISVITWLATGYYLWQIIGVDGFGKGIMWFISWGIVGGIFQSLIVPLISLAIIAVLSFLFGKKL